MLNLRPERHGLLLDGGRETLGLHEMCSEAGYIRHGKGDRMKPVYQTAFSPPEGDCVRASLASCLELPLGAVPHFRGDKWEEAANLWLAEKFGLGLIPVTINVEPFPAGVGYHLIDGPSLSGDWNHVVVGWRGQLAHDPNPNSCGPKGVEAFYLFVALDPSQSPKTGGRHDPRE